MCDVKMVPEQRHEAREDHNMRKACDGLSWHTPLSNGKLHNTEDPLANLIEAA